MIHDSRDTLVWFSPGTIVRKNAIERNRYGLHYMQTDDQVIEDNILRDNSVGIYLMYGRNYELSRNLMANNRGSSGYGLGLKEVNDVRRRREPHGEQPRRRLLRRLAH